MKKLLFGLMLFAGLAEAGLITRTYNYTAGNTITANENNTNENTLYTEVNGNLNAANLLDGGITNADLADTQITASKFAASVTSTFTAVNNHWGYRRPVLRFVSVTTVDVEANTGTANETCIYFPDGDRRCVTENTSSTSVNRRFIITETASFTGTKNSGLTSPQTEAVNTWYSVFAVKVQDNSTDFVLAGSSTALPSQSNFSTLNTAYGTSGWVFLGYIRNGNNADATGDILNFRSSANMTFFANTSSGTLSTSPGIRIANSATTALTYSYALGLSNVAIPDTIEILKYRFAKGGGGAGDATVDAGSGGVVLWIADNATKNGDDIIFTRGNDIRVNSGSGSVGMDIFLTGYWDGALSGAAAPPY